MKIKLSAKLRMTLAGAAALASTFGLTLDLWNNRDIWISPYQMIYPYSPWPSHWLILLPVQVFSILYVFFTLTRSKPTETR